MSGIDREREAEKRRLRVAIGRSRRRIDRRLRGTNRAAEHLVSWKTYVRRWPGLGLVAGLGVGWILAAGLRPRFLVGMFGTRLVRDVSRRFTDLLAGELKGIWANSAPRADSGEAEGGADG